MALSSARTPDYTLGRGKLFFAEFTSGQTPGPMRYLGNSPQFSMTISAEELEHQNSDAGINEVDASVPLSVDRTGSITLDDIQAENVALFFFGGVEALTQVAAAGQSETFTGVNGGDVYQLGRTTNNPVGTRGVSSVVVEPTGGGTAYILDTDYSLDADRGMFSILETGNIAAGAGIDVNFDIDAATSERITSGSEPIEGMLRFVEDNPAGTDRDITLPYVKVTPNGDLALKGDEWRSIPFSFEALKPQVGAAIYLDGQPQRS